MSTTNIGPESPNPSRAEIRVTRILIKEGYQPSKGLGPHLSEFPQDSNTILMCEDPSQPNKPVKDERVEVEALVEMERWIGQEKPKFQPLVDKLEGINLGGETEKKEVRVGKQMPPDLRFSLIGLLKEYADVFAWSYQDMSGLDRGIVEHKLPLLPDLVPVRQ
ncbi:hypothetical protein CR513_58230, partial [Mucuna pruriens]